MVRMKWFFWAAACLALLDDRAFAGRSGPELRICEDLLRQVVVEYLEEGRPMSGSWNEFAEVRLTLEGVSTPSRTRMEFINTLAVVPGVPVVRLKDAESRRDLDIPWRFTDFGVLLISRKVTVRAVDGAAGRYVALIVSGDGQPEGVRAYARFVPEETADAILEQIPDLDPEAQPIVFAEEWFVEAAKAEESRARIREQALEQARSEIQARESTLGQGGEKDISRSAKPSSGSSILSIPLLVAVVCGVLLLASLVLLSWRRRLD